MNELIKITYDNDRPTVSARELHEFLGVDTRYNDWFPRMCEYGFAEGTDFNLLKNEQVRQEGKRMVTRIVDDAQLTIDMAKEICMLQRNDKGKQARQYFIQLEKDWNSPEKVMARALRIADEKIRLLSLENSKQKQIIGELKPLADYTDMILKNKGLVTTNQIAKDYGMSARALNKKLHELGVQYKQSEQWLLYEKYQACGYTHSKTVEITHKDGSPDVKMHTKWTQKGRLFIYNLLKEQNILPVIEQEQKTA